MKTLLQIVPQLPGTHEGVGDYALNLASALLREFQVKTVFALPRAAPDKVGDFSVRSFDLSSSASTTIAQGCDDVLLHYVNYGYHQRGVPRELPGFLQTLRQTVGLRISVVFHELFAEVKVPWRSAFWLRPIQIRIAGEIAALADVCFVSSEGMAAQLQRVAQPARVRIQPVMSNFGEPILTAAELAARDPHRWVICGGTALVARSVASFPVRLGAIPAQFSPRELYLIGGQPNETVRANLRRLQGLKVEYLPGIEATAASDILSSCSFAWLDYFREPEPPAGAILKSTAFAAYLAHGVIPIVPHSGLSVQVRDDGMPGPFFVGPSGQSLPAEAERASTALALYEWYQRHASSRHLAATIASTLGQAA